MLEITTKDSTQVVQKSNDIITSSYNSNVNFSSVLSPAGGNSVSMVQEPPKPIELIEEEPKKKRTFSIRANILQRPANNHQK